MDMTESNPLVHRLRLMVEVDEQPQRLFSSSTAHKISLIFEIFQKLEAANKVVTFWDNLGPQTDIVEAVGVQLQLEGG